LGRTVWVDDAVEADELLNNSDRISNVNLTFQVNLDAGSEVAGRLIGVGSVGIADEICSH
jgi:hypothetical protein